MKKSNILFACLAASLSVVCLIGCGSDGPTANTDQMAAARDAQGKAMQAQQAQRAANPAAGAQTSIDAAGKAGKN